MLRVTVRRAAAHCGVRRGGRGGARSCSARALGSEFLPQLDEGTIWVRANFPAGISLDEIGRDRGKIRAHPARHSRRCKLVSSQTGRNDSGTDPYGPNRNEFFVALKPYDTWPPGMRKADLVDQISQQAARADSGRELSASRSRSSTTSPRRSPARPPTSP